jgi:hypothetical protein
MPVTVETAVAIGAAGERSPRGAAPAAVAAKANGAKTSDNAVARRNNGARRFMARD